MSKKILSLLIAVCLVFTINVPTFAEAVHSAEIGVWARIVQTYETNDNYNTYNITIEWDETDDSIKVMSENNIETSFFNGYEDTDTVTVTIIPGKS